jgi:hypothetical protein
MPIPITCARCHASYTVDDDLQGKSIRCRECDLPVFVEAPAAADVEVAPAAAIHSQPCGPSQPPFEPVAPPARARGEAAAPPDVRRKSHRPLVLALLGGCLGLSLLLAVGGGFLAWFAWSRDLIPGLGDSGDSPEPSLVGGPMAATPPEALVTLHISGADESTREAIQDQLPALVDGGRAYALTSQMQGDRLTVVVAPVRDPDAFARKIDFGTVRRVRGRTITLVAQKVAGPPPNADPVAKALHELKSPNPFRRADAARRLKDMIPDERRAQVAAALGPLLNDPQWLPRDEAIEAIAVWGSGANVPALLRALNHPESRRAAMLALGRLKDERAAEPLASRLEELGDMHTAAEALKAMGPVAEKAVRQRLNHHEPFVRAEVCGILKVIGTRDSLPALRQVVTENDFFASGEASAAIRAITAREGRRAAP